MDLINIMVDSQRKDVVFSKDVLTEDESEAKWRRLLPEAIMDAWPRRAPWCVEEESLRSLHYYIQCGSEHIYTITLRNNQFQHLRPDIVTT